MISERLLRLRKEKGLSQEALAQAINVSRQSISNFESGISLPNLNNLTQLARFYNLTLDQLVYGNDCSKGYDIEIESDELINFLVLAKKNTYANKTNELEILDENTFKYQYIKDNYKYIDTYYGSTSFVGNEVVYLSDVAIFALNYSGIVLDDNFNSNFLKEALLKVDSKMPYRGPKLYSNNEYTYICKVNGDIDYFEGYEEIYYKDIKVYQLYFNGAKTY